jgi:molybdopterin molybdotransferase
VEEARLVGTKSVHLPAAEGGLIDLAGSFLKRGQRILGRGELINERSWALLRSCDLATVPIVQHPTVHIVAVGSELDAGGFPEVNGRFLLHFLETLHIPAVLLGAVPDQEERIREEVKNGIPGGLLLVTGGTGLGLMDRTIMAIRPAEIRLLCEGITLCPGESTALAVGRQGACIFMPGAPEAVLAVAYALLKPVVAAWLGISLPIWNRGARRALEQPWTGPADRYVLVAAAAGEGPLRLKDAQGSGALFGAERLVVLPAGQEVRTQGVIAGP